MGGGGVTLKAVIADLLAYGLEHRAEATRRAHRQKAGHLLRVFGEETTVDELTMDRVSQYHEIRLAEGAHRSTVFKENSLLNQVLKWGRQRGMHHREPRSIVASIRNEYEPRTRFLDPSEVTPLLAELTPRRQRWVLLALYTGARRSAVEGMEWRDVNLPNLQLLVRGTKTKRSRRHVPIPAALEAMLREVPVHARHGPLVEPWSGVAKGLKRACRRAGIEAVTPNDLRRTYASWLMQAGAEAFVVARLMGTSVEMIDKTYGHLKDDNLRSAVALLPDTGALDAGHLGEAASSTTRVVIGPPGCPDRTLVDRADLPDPGTVPAATSPSRPPDVGTRAATHAAKTVADGRSPARTNPPTKQPHPPVGRVGLVSPVGLEPTARGLKVRCSTS